ncbi:MAG: DUF4350 domain-containing protein [Bacteroidota bacterium]|nr:DUF4350 domain-containing protein [Bacteroidota bacterium]
MKNAFPYIIGAVVLLLLIVIMASTNNPSVRRMDERITLRQKDKIPYGTRVAKDLLPLLFPGTKVISDNKYPGAWDSVDVTQPNQAVILVTDNFDANKSELEELSEFVQRGNYVFIIARNGSDAVSSFFHLSFNSYYLSSSGAGLQIKLERPTYTSDSTYTYPGKQFESFFYELDTAYTAVLGRSSKDQPDFINLIKARGIFLFTVRHWLLVIILYCIKQMFIISSRYFRCFLKR